MAHLAVFLGLMEGLKEVEGKTSFVTVTVERDACTGRECPDRQSSCQTHPSISIGTFRIPFSFASMPHYNLVLTFKTVLAITHLVLRSLNGYLCDIGIIGILVIAALVPHCRQWSTPHAVHL